MLIDTPDAIEIFHPLVALSGRASPKRPTPIIAASLTAICAACLPGSVHGQAGWQIAGNTIYAPAGTNVGIGTANPSVPLHVEGKTYSSSGFWVAGGDLVNTVNGATWYGLGLSNLNYVPAWPTVTAVQLAGWGGINFQTATGRMVIRGDSGNVGIGTTAPQYKLAVNGTLGAKEVIVTNTGWADYVFKPDYRPRPLNDLAAFIRERHHLPDIPSEAEIRVTGVNLGEMQVKLLAKIEELTLHMIRANERNDRLEQENLKLQKQNQSNQARIVRLEALVERQITNQGRKPE